MDLGIPQKPLRVRLKEEKKRKGHSVFHEQIERKREGEQGDFLSSEEEESRTLAHIPRQHSANQYNKVTRSSRQFWGMFFKVEPYSSFGTHS